MDNWHDFTQVYRCTNLTFLFTDWARLLSSHKGDLCHLSRQRECKYPLSLYNLWILYNLPVSWFHNFPIILHCAKKKIVCPSACMRTLLVHSFYTRSAHNIPYWYVFYAACLQLTLQYLVTSKLSMYYFTMDILLFCYMCFLSGARGIEI